ncbi:CAAX protease self-immunity-domain-containing protein [Cyathus striatus]|nr:CAAX protease self-immunity-domain-containing protein [Cyathus striatus]
MDNLPTLSTPTAHLLSLLFSASYVGSLYISKGARLSFAKPEEEPEARKNLERRKMDSERWRDDPDVIKARLVAVSGASVVCVGVVWGVLYSDSRMPLQALKGTLTVLGLRPSLSPMALLAHLPVPILFFGSLFTSYLEGVLPGQKSWSWKQSVKEKFGSWVGIRNYSLAPFTEEIVFRSCVLAAYHMSGASRTKMIFLSPLVFGLAHIHHAWDTYNRYGRTREALKRAVLGSVFQLLYTTLFGSIASYLFLRTGRLYPALSAHVFCNIMGVPGVSGVRRYVTTLAAYVLGIAGFVYTLPRWTETPGSLFWN